MSLTEEDYAKINEQDTVNKRVALAKPASTPETQNKDVYGYIKIPGTKVDDIIVQAEDNDYLNHSWKGIICQTARFSQIIVVTETS